MVAFVRGDVGVGPGRERVDLHDPAADVEVRDRRICARRRLDPAQSGHPRLLAAQGFTPRQSTPRVRIQLSPKLWLGSFLVTSLIYLVQVDAEGISAGRWPLLAPWLHTAALPVFAVLSVVVALVYRAVENWLSDYETYARETVARVALSVAQPLLVPHPALGDLVAPRSLFGLAFESRPPPAPA